MSKAMKNYLEAEYEILIPIEKRASRYTDFIESHNIECESTQMWIRGDLIVLGSTH